MCQGQATEDGIAAAQVKCARPGLVCQARGSGGGQRVEPAGRGGVVDRGLGDPGRQGQATWTARRREGPIRVKKRA